jgi:hypothetical protein
MPVRLLAHTSYSTPPEASTSTPTYAFKHHTYLARIKSWMSPELLLGTPPRSGEDAGHSGADGDARKGYLEMAFQKSLNVGFKQVYLTVVIASVLALLLMAFYRKNRSADKNEK